jgi:alkylation response protein AidB-like acyl-CoA dehydrogenase
MNFSLNEEQTILKSSTIKFAKNELNSDLIHREQQGEFIWENWNKCCQMGLTGLPIPKEYGGSGTDLTTTLICIEALSYGCKDSGLVHALVTQLCCGVQILIFGNDFQKQNHLLGISSGKKIAAQALTEPDAGSDIGSMKTKADKLEDKYILNGTKLFISNGPISDLVFVFAMITESEHRRSYGNISCLLVEKGTKGFYREKPLEKMGLRTLQNGELVFEACEVPFENLLGKEGQGLFIFNEIIEWERMLMSACHLGVMERISEICIKYAKNRSQFGKPIGKFQSISNKIAEMKVNIELGRLILHKAGWLKDQKKRATLETSISKLFISENLKHACLEAIQIHGAYGYMKECEMERELRNSIASTLYSGTSEIQKNIISSLIGL